jgi:transaldolase
LCLKYTSRFTDVAKLFDLCVSAQRYYEKHGYETKVLPASLVSTEECSMLAVVNHITIAPHLLLALSQAPAGVVKSIFDGPPPTGPEYNVEKRTFMDDEAAYRIAFTRSGAGQPERKLSEAINIFCDQQLKIEEMMVEK